MEKTSNWGSLPDLLLDSILKNLVSLHDYVRFSAVCKHWCAAAVDPNMEKLHIEISANNQLPLLMIPTIKGSRKSRTLYNISQGRANYDIELLVPFHRRCCGSSHGWLAFAMDDLFIILFNPFAGARIDLPRLVQITPDYDAEYFVKKVVLSANPITNPDYEVAVIYGDMHQLAFIKACYEKSWSFIELDYWKITIDDFVDSKAFVVSDVIYHKGIIHCVKYHNRISNDTPARLLSIDTSSGRRQPGKSFRSGVLDDRVRADLLEVKTYLVESSSGKVLILRRFRSLDDGIKLLGLTSKFEVYEVKGKGIYSRLKRVQSLGGDALFLGDSYSMSVLASDFPGCRPNSIYFTDDYIENFYRNGPRDMAIFNLKDESIESHYVPNLMDKIMPPPIWITPTPTMSKFR